jgi:hypothetical protein
MEAILAKKPDCLVRAPSDMEDYLNAGLRIKDKWHDQCKLLREAMKNGTAVFLDTEFIILDSGTCLPLEIAILDHEGTTIANTEIDHRIPVNKLDGMAKSFGKSPRQLAKALIEAGINKDSVFIEWSTNGCDFKMLKELVGDELGLPAAMQPIRLTQLWIRAAPDLPSYRLSVVHALTFPDSKLYDRAHRALPDTQMLFDMTKKFLEVVEF